MWFPLHIMFLSFFQSSEIAPRNHFFFISSVLLSFSHYFLTLVFIFTLTPRFFFLLPCSGLFLSFVGTACCPQEAWDTRGILSFVSSSPLKKDNLESAESNMTMKSNLWPPQNGMQTWHIFLMFLEHFPCCPCLSGFPLRCWFLKLSLKASFLNCIVHYFFATGLLDIVGSRSSDVCS